jgi:hypothetical protein
MTRALRTAYWLGPIAFCVALYWLGLRIWFAQDDFAWLNLRNHVTDLRSFLWAMFAPLAQGTIRPWSERGFFMAFSYLFGLRALPYRTFVFLNQFLNVVLVTLIARKLTRSELAGFLAPLFWLSNIALISPMSWNSSYNEIQCASFLLLSFYLFIRYTETAERKFYWMQWVTFVLGFGALEINLVYPAIAALYSLLFARRYFRSTLPMFVVSVAFAVIDRLAGTQPGNFYYDMDFHPGALITTFWQYWNILLGISTYGNFKGWRPDLTHSAAILLTAAIVVFALWETRKRRWLPLFFIGWFFIVLGPLLPLHNHVTDYYLTIPGIGMAMLAAYALSMAWQRGWAVTAIAAVLALSYFVPSINMVRAGVMSYFDRADRVRALIQSVAYAKHIHPGKVILLKDVDDDLFWACVYDSPFHIFGWNDVFLAPDSRSLVHEDPHLNPVDGYFLPESAARRVVDDDAAVVYAVEGRKLRNITKPYRILVDGQPPPPLARSIDVGFSLFREQLGDGWYGLEAGFRWSGKHAVVYLPGPAAAGQRLYLHGFATDSQMKLGPLRVDLTIDGRAMPMQVLAGPGSEFRLNYDLPPDLVGRPKIEVAFTVDRTIQPPGETRNLGLAFGQFTIK